MTSSELATRLGANPHNLPGIAGAPPLSPHDFWAARFEQEGRLANATRAELAKVKQSLADPTQPERASDIARLVAERDTARNALAAVQARADRQKEALDSMADNFEAMALRVAKAEAAMRRAGLIAAA